MTTFRSKAVVPAIFCFMLASAPNSQSQQSPDIGDRMLRVAILSGNGVEREADLLGAELSSHAHRIALLERSDLAAVTAEGTLVAGKIPASLESADILILVEAIEIHQAFYLATRLVGRDDGRVHSSDLRAAHHVDKKWSEEMANLLRDFTRALPKSERETAVSIRAIREEYTAGKIEEGLVSIALTRLVNAELSRAKQVRVLERIDLPLIQFERFLTRVDGTGFEEADRTVSGTFRSGGGSTRFTLRVETPGTNDVARIDGDVPTENLGEVATAMAAKLALLLSTANDESAESDPNSPPVGISTTAESNRFADEADRALRLGLHENAAKFAETAFLLEPTEKFRSLYLLACAELFAAFPELRGRGINLDGEISAGRRDSGSSDPVYRINLLPYSSSGNLPPLPQPEQWSALATAAERISDLERCTLDMEEGPGNAARAKLSYFTKVVSKVTGEAVLNGFTAFGNTLPPFERKEIERIAAGCPPSFLPIPDSLILKSSPGQAVEQIHEWLYGPEIESLKRPLDGDYGKEWRRASILRHHVFAYFEHLGYDDRIDKMSTVVDERILRKPFVAFLSNTPTSFEDAFSLALADAEAEHGLLTRVDAQLRRAAAARSETERSNEFGTLRTLILKNIQELKAVGMLELYADMQASLERLRYSVSKDSDPFAYWKSIHAALLEEDGWYSGHLTDRLIDIFDGKRRSPDNIPDPRRRHDFLAALREDISTNGNVFARASRQGALWKIEEKMKELGLGESAEALPGITGGKTARQAAGIPDPDTIEIAYSSFGYQLQTLATEVVDDGIFTFQIGRPGGNARSYILKFDLAGNIEEISVPEEIHDLVYKSLEPETLMSAGRAGGLRVGKDSIDVVFPGGMATYRRAVGEWEVTPIAFLGQRHAATFAGDSIISYTGIARTRSVSPVQGLYLNDPKTASYTALIDTSREPPLHQLDSSKRLAFTGSPFAFAENRIVFATREADHRQRVYQLALNTGLDGDKNQPILIPFQPGPNARLHMSRANGFVLLAATRPPKPLNEFYVENSGRMHLGACAIDERGEFHWLLDSGIFPAHTSLPSSGDGESERKFFLPQVVTEPLFRFPSEFSAPQGRFNQMPESFSVELGPLFLRPVLHFNGSRLLLLSDEMTEDNRRLLYVWRNVEDMPKRFAIRFASFRRDQDSNDEGVLKWNQWAQNTVVSIFEWRNLLVFEYDRGFFSIPIGEFEKHLGE